MKKFRVEFYMDNTYLVINNDNDTVVYQGSLSDCESYIRLREGGYISHFKEMDLWMKYKKQN